MTKKKNYGLAAQLAQPRPLITSEPPPVATREHSEIQSSKPSVAAVVEPDDSDGVADDNSMLFDHSDRNNQTKRRSGKQKKPGPTPREGGYIRRTITLGTALSDYVDRAWRTYRTPAGKYVSGVSAFIEAVIDEHRRRAK